MRGKLPTKYKTQIATKAHFNFPPIRADFVPPGAIPPGIWTAADVVEMSDCGYEEVYGRCICEQFVMYLSGDIIFQCTSTEGEVDACLWRG